MMTHQELLRFFHSKYPQIVKSMRESNHALSSDSLNLHHLEGSVFTHSMLVLHESVRRGYGFETQLACLLHDIGKPFARTVKDDKKVTFYSHEGFSVFLALTIMEDLKLPQPIRERLVKVIGLHTEVFKQPLQSLYELIDDEETYYSLTRLATCDHNGRFNDNSDGGIIDYELFLPKIKERDEIPKSKQVTIMVGLPYSGKSTYINKIMEPFYSDCTIPDYLLISRDEIIESLNGVSYNDKWKNADQKLVDKELQNQFKKIKDYSTVYVDMTHMSAKSRRKTLSHFGKEWQKNCIVMLPTLLTIEERQKLRIDKVIDNSVMDAMIKAFRPPCSGEGFDNIEYIF